MFILGYFRKDFDDGQQNEPDFVEPNKFTQPDLTNPSFYFAASGVLLGRRRSAARIS